MATPKVVLLRNYSKQSAIDDSQDIIDEVVQES